jgi:PIN domain nuclease of toxin-antitoxin system
LNILLDTHVLLWWLTDDPAIGAGRRSKISDVDNVVFVSVTSIWEIMIKASIGKLDIPIDFRAILDDQPFMRMDVTTDHAFKLSELPAHHRDPIDRMLVAQAMVESLVLATDDPIIQAYGVPTLGPNGIIVA